jgi:hypothetical protein
MTGSQQSGSGGNPEFQVGEKSVGGVSSAHAPGKAKPDQRQEDPRIANDPDRGPSRTSRDREPSGKQQQNDDESSKLD